MITIVTGPTHCGKSTYLQSIDELTEQGIYTIDLFDYQEMCNTFNELLVGQYDFYRDIEKKCRNTSKDLWIEGTFSNPIRIKQIIDSVRAAGRQDEIRIIYILRDEDWYIKNLDPIVAAYSVTQMEQTKLYNNGDAAVYKLNNSNILEEVK